MKTFEVTTNVGDSPVTLCGMKYEVDYMGYLRIFDATGEIATFDLGTWGRIRQMDPPPTDQPGAVEVVAT